MEEPQCLCFLIAAVCPTTMLENALFLAREYGEANTPFQLHSSPLSDGEQIWQPPVHSMVKCNTDTALSSTSLCAGLSAVIQNASGTVLSGFSRACSASDAFQPEALALREACVFVQARGFSEVTFEIDCKQLCDAVVHCSPPARWNSAGFVADIALLARDFHSACFKYAPRAANTVTDWLARQSLAWSLPLNWHSCILPPFWRLLVSDLVSAALDPSLIS